MFLDELRSAGHRQRAPARSRFRRSISTGRRARSRRPDADADAPRRSPTRRRTSPSTEPTGTAGSRAERASWSPVAAISSPTSRPGSNRCMERAPITSAGIAGNVVLDVRRRRRSVIDFVEASVRPWAGEPFVYKITVDRRLSKRSSSDHVEDWVNSLFLSCRFRAVTARAVQRVRDDVLQGARRRNASTYVERSYRRAAAPTSSSNATAGASNGGARTARPTSRASARSPTACSRARCTTGSSSSRPGRCLTSDDRHLRCERVART